VPRHPIQAGRVAFWLAVASAAACSHDWSPASDGELDAEAGDAADDGLADESAGDDATAEDGAGDATCEADGVVEAGEECDDGNCVDGDGCDHDQTFSCHVDTDCADDNACTTEACEPTSTGRACAVTFTSDPCDDGDPCTTGDHCAEGACVPVETAVRWYLDADGDGWGDPDTWSCDPDPTRRWVDNHGDCCDRLSDVRPDQISFFGAAYACTPGVSQWDYDCDGLLEPQLLGCVVCATSPDGSCATTPGWMREVGTECEAPFCGESGSYVTACANLGGACQPSVLADTVQPCN